MYDTHCHLNFKAFNNDYRQVIKSSLAQGMILNIVGSQYETSRRAVEIAHEFENEPVYAAVGLHPSHLGSSKFKVQSSKLQFKVQNLKELEDESHQWDYEKYKSLALDSKVVAIGETGIDLFRGADTLEEQEEIFKEHIKLALEVRKPLILHCRPSKNSFDAYEEMLEIISNFQFPISNFCVLHCFLADWTIAQKFLELGLYISVTGIITFKNIDSYLVDVIRQIPIGRLLIETDAPYITPEPYRGQRRNEPLYVEFVARKIAEIKEMEYNEVIKKTTENGRRLFLNFTL